jgi:peptidoglycan/xylan/chitin deacetylase (PgdA/CDA1 family)
LNLFRTPAFLPWLYPQLTWRVDTPDKDLYLTFDDGPVPGPTEFVLEELQKAHAQATFFCIGENISKHPSIFQKVTAAGHTIGNHTFNHLSGWKTRTQAYLDNIELCEDQIQSGPLQPATSSQKLAAPFFRPPYGRITRSQIKALNKYRIVMWDVLTHDYAQSLSPEKCLEGALKATRPGSVVVFHDSIKAERNLRYALPRFIDHFGELGYAFKSLR